MPKYIDGKIVKNNEEIYEELFEERGLKDGVKQFATKTFEGVEKNGVKIRWHTWSLGDKLFKLSYRYYSTYQWWWIIALFNGKPTDAHYEFGDKVAIPLNPQKFING